MKIIATFFQRNVAKSKFDNVSLVKPCEMCNKALIHRDSYRKTGGRKKYIVFFGREKVKKTKKLIEVLQG